MPGGLYPSYPRWARVLKLSQGEHVYLAAISLKWAIAVGWEGAIAENKGFVYFGEGEIAVGRERGDRACWNELL